MRFATQEPPPFDIAEWQAKPFADRARLAAQAFGIGGQGQPLLTYLFYGCKLAFYVAAWVFFCSFSPHLGDFSSAEWWLHPTAFQKAVAWSMLFEVLGFGCGSGPLSGRIEPAFTAFRHWLWPGSTKLPLFEGAPVIGKTTRSLLDVGLYAALVVCLLRALVAAEPGAAHWLPIAVLCPLLGALDKTIFLAARSEHYWVLITIFALVDKFIAAAMVVQLALWFFAGVSKLNSHFPSVVAAMTSNSPFATRQRRRSMYRDYPTDMRPSRVAVAHAVLGTALEFSVPAVLFAALWLQSPALLFVGMALMLALHCFILSNVPMGAPLEWNVMMVYAGFAVFYAHPDVTPLQPGSVPVAILLVLTCLVVPVAGNLWPAKVSFLLAMRYYAGNWPVSVYLFRSESHQRLERVTKAAPWLDEQMANLPIPHSAEQNEFASQSNWVFRLMHLHGRAIHSLLPRLVDDIEQYMIVDGEVVAGLVLGWNFGEGHLHQEQLVRALQSQCEFEEGELRCLFLEAQPLFGKTQDYRFYDAKSGEIEAGQFPVQEMRALQPWPAESPHIFQPTSAAVSCVTRPFTVRPPFRAEVGSASTATHPAWLEREEADTQHLEREAGSLWDRR